MRPPLSGPHGASLATTAGITAVITGVVAVSVMAQAPSATGLAAQLAAVTGGALAVAAGLLYQARNAIGLGLDHAGDPPLALYWTTRALRQYHGGMAALFVGLAVAAAWRLGLTLGPSGWLAAIVLLGFAGSALNRALKP